MFKNPSILIDEIFKVLNDYLIQKEDGSYIFKNNEKSLSLSRNWRYEFDFDPIERICKRFEREIVPKIPHAILIIKDKLTIEVNIDKNNKYTRKISLMKKEIDIYESIKTIFFPIMQERLVKFGKSDLEWLYFSPKNNTIINLTKETEDSKNGDIRFVINGSWQIRGIEGAAIDFLKEDIARFLRNFKFRNPIPFSMVVLPQKDLTLEDLKQKYNNKVKGIYSYEFYSYEQKRKYIKSLFEDFFQYYSQIIKDNFSRLKKSFTLFSKLPVKITVKTQKWKGIYGKEDLLFVCGFDKLPNDSKSYVELVESNNLELEKNYFNVFETTFSYLLRIDDFSLTGHIWGSNRFNYGNLSAKNALPYTYQFIAKELDDIIEKFRDDTIFVDSKLYHPSDEYWINKILEVEKFDDVRDKFEFIKISKNLINGDSLGNDIYTEINAFENSDGGYIFIGVDKEKKGMDKIVGIENYLTKYSENVDMVIRKISEKCIKYLRRDYPIRVIEYKGKTVLHIKIFSNDGRISRFHTDTGKELNYIRQKGEKRQMTKKEIFQRLLGRQMTKYYVFISSTIKDEKILLRQDIKKKLESIENVSPILSEFAESFPKSIATNKDAFQESIEIVKVADIFVLIINETYGNIKPGENISITEAEYKQAVNSDIPRIIFIKDSVNQDYDRYSPMNKEQREGFCNILKTKGYDKPKKLMNFIRNIIKLKPYKPKDNWCWPFNMGDISRFLTDLESQIKFYIKQIEANKLV